MPILKQSGSSHSKKRSRIDRQMISAPLGDFRHTMHVGRGGDVFGDTSFLSNHGPSQPTVALASPISPTSPTTPKSPSSPKANGTPRPTVEDHSFQEGRTKTGSLSQLSQSSGIESGSGSWASSPVHYGSPKEDSSEAWSTGTSRGDVERIDWLSSSSDTGLKHAESILSFHLDLGPSIMDEVLGVMDKESPAGDWQRMEDQFDFGFKYNKEVDAENGCLPSPTLCADVDIPAVRYGLSSPLGNDHVLDSPSSSASGTLEKNNSSFEGDSEEEKRSVYEGITNGSVQGMASRSDAGQEDNEEAGKGYTFDDDSDDSDDEIGV